MGGYLVNFIVYTMAMVGLIFFALMVYKKFYGGNFGSRNSKFLKVEDTLGLAPRKNLYVVRAGNERFLIAGDVDKTTLISKLDDSKVEDDFNSFSPVSNVSNISEKYSTKDDFEEFRGSSVIRSMVNKMNR